MQDHVLLHLHEWVRFDQCTITRERILALIMCDLANIHTFATRTRNHANPFTRVIELEFQYNSLARKQHIHYIAVTFL